MKLFSRIVLVILVLCFVVSAVCISAFAYTASANFYNTNNLFLSVGSSSQIYSRFDDNYITTEYYTGTVQRHFVPDLSGDSLSFYIPGSFVTPVPVTLTGSFVASSSLIDFGLVVSCSLGTYSTVVDYSLYNGRCYFSVDLPFIDEAERTLVFTFSNFSNDQEEYTIMLLTCVPSFNSSTVIPSSSIELFNNNSTSYGSINGNFSNSIPSAEFMRSESYDTMYYFSHSLPDQAHITQVLCDLHLDLSSYVDTLYFTIPFNLSTSSLVAFDLRDDNGVSRPFNCARSNFVDETTIQTGNANYPIRYTIDVGYLDRLNGTQTSNAINLTAVYDWRYENFVDQETFVSQSIVSLVDTCRGVITFPWEPSWGTPSMSFWVLDSYGSKLLYSQNLFGLSIKSPFFNTQADYSVLDEHERVIFDAINNLGEDIHSSIVDSSVITNSLINDFYNDFVNYAEMISDYLSAVNDKSDDISSGTNDVVNSENAVHEQSGVILQNFSHGFSDFTESNNNLSWVNYSYGFQFVSHYLQGAFDGMGGWSVVFSMPLFYGIFFFIIGHVRTMVFIPRHNADVTDRKSIRK